MTQTQSAPPATWSPAAPAGTAVQAPAPGPAGRGAVARWFDGTPGRMRAFLILAAAMSVVFGLAAAQGFQQSDGALQRAQDNAAQLVRIQAIHTNLVSANADATNAFLVGGLEPPGQRQQFVDSLAAAAGLIAEAATAQPADRDALGALNKTLITYEGLIEQARANNRQGLPIGSQYLKDANSVLQNDSLPLVKALVDANEKRVGTEFDGVGYGTIWVIAGGVLTLLIFALTLRWLARRTHRYLNVPIAAGGVLVLLTTVIGGVLLAGASSAANDTNHGAYDRTVGLSRARIAAYDARSNESLTLIARGSGDSFDKAYNASAGEVLNQVDKLGDSALQSQWLTYGTVHKYIRDQDSKGQWDNAVSIAIGQAKTPYSTDSVTAFDQFDSTSDQRLQEASSAVQGKLGDARTGLAPLGWLGLAVGIAAALLVAWGMSQRLEEYR
ncbi:hypothetical protein [Kribbella solani]|uniref:Secreted protein n=1 Tax=Kribbella solani TaxID=236067 RepID=A0A841E220_9ACTN|nr:hypothetical protein [Kribbella solani]MBB5983076.1 hypothetical protein [Kribbella solani]